MNTNRHNESWIVCLATFPPRLCGIATFTTDLTNAIERMFGPSIKTKIVAMNLTNVSRFSYPDKVVFEISQPRKEDYVAAAEKLNSLKEVKLINVQHEFGIYGGDYGSYLLLFLKKLQKPAVITMHTVLPSPDIKMLSIVQAIMKYSKGIIVMTGNTKHILVKEYGLDPSKVKVVPHGIHHVPYRSSNQNKSSLGFYGKKILSTFGFLSPGKGVEYVLEAMPRVIDKFPDTRFLIAGVTHPAVLEQEGEAYRNFLIKKVHHLGLSNHVHFYNTYFDINKLLQFLEATDIYISTSLSPNQAVSGTLSYALGSGRPVVSTAFAQAKQDISRMVGILVDFKNPMAYSKAIVNLLSNDELSLKMGKTAYFRTRHMTWDNVAHSYMKFYSQFAPELKSRQRKLPPIKLTHLSKLTDDFGIIQFAKLTKPDISSGYTIDDNARALIVTSLHYKKFKTDYSLRLISIYLNFFNKVTKPDGYFDNYVSSKRIVDKKRNIKESSEDPSARALYALALTSTTKQIPKHIRKQAHSLFEQSFQRGITFSSPRAIAFYVKALYSLLTKWKNPVILTKLKLYCEILIALYESSHTTDWEWFEPYLTYSNAVLPEALLLGYKITKEKRFFEVSKKTLDFLISHTFKDGIYVPIGQSGWFPKEGTRQYFDQQPEDTTAMVETLNAMSLATKDKHYNELAVTAFNWFLGDNILGQVVYDRTTGGCYDGVGEKFINLNQGAESTISYLLARLSFKD